MLSMLYDMHLLTSKAADFWEILAHSGEDDTEEAGGNGEIDEIVRFVIWSYFIVIF